MTRRHGQPAFTRSEVLTVVGILALVLAVLLPALAHIRGSSKLARSGSTLAAVEKGLEMFALDFGQYPDSRLRGDPIDWEGRVTDHEPLSGAHWLARALVGHDLGGLDLAAATLDDADLYRCGGSDSVKPVNPTVAQLRSLPRKPLYMGDTRRFVQDNNRTAFPGLPAQVRNSGFNYRPTGRLVVYDDAFGSPILYYRANRHARFPFCRTGDGQAPVGARTDDQLGIYRQQDNAAMAGDEAAKDYGWDFAGTGDETPHGLYAFGLDPPGADEETAAGPVREPSFAGFLRDPAARDGRLLPWHPDRFILIAAGRDGRFGTADDLTNFATTAPAQGT